MFQYELEDATIDDLESELYISRFHVGAKATDVCRLNEGTRWHDSHN